MKKYIFILFLLMSAACIRRSEIIEIPLVDTPIPVSTDKSAEKVVTPPDEPTPPQEVPLYNDYHISLEVDPETHMVTGIQRIRFTNHTGNTLDTIVMRTYLNAFSQNADILPYFTQFENNIFKTGKDYGYIEILHVSKDKDELTYEHNGTVLNIHLSEPLEAEETVQLLLQFKAYIPKIAHRTGRNNNAMWMGMFLPVLSVHNGQNWDTTPYYPAGEPFLLETAHYTVQVTTPPEYTVAGSGNKKEDIMENKKVITFIAHMTRDFAFTVSPAFNLAETVTESGVSIHFYYYSDGLPVDEILDIAKRSMEYFEEKVGKYPYGHISIVETDMFVNGMEFSKIVFMDSAYLHRTDNFASLVHELGHQWFYNVIGNNPITQAWLDEGMTMYVQEGFFHEDEAAFHKKMKSEYASFKARTGSWVIANDISMFHNWQDYYITHYSKAKLMMYALHCRMGDDAFWQCINQYYQAQSFRIADASDFITVAEEAYGESLEDFFEKWLYRKDLPDI